MQYIHQRKKKKPFSVSGINTGLLFFCWSIWAVIGVKVLCNVNNSDQIYACRYREYGAVMGHAHALVPSFFFETKHKPPELSVSTLSDKFALDIKPCID